MIKLSDYALKKSSPTQLVIEPKEKSATNRHSINQRHDSQQFAHRNKSVGLSTLLQIDDQSSILGSQINQRQERNAKSKNLKTADLEGVISDTQKQVRLMKQKRQKILNSVFNYQKSRITGQDEHLEQSKLSIPSPNLSESANGSKDSEPFNSYSNSQSHYSSIEQIRKKWDKEFDKSQSFNRLTDFHFVQRSKEQDFVGENLLPSSNLPEQFESKNHCRTRNRFDREVEKLFDTQKQVKLVKTLEREIKNRNLLKMQRKLETFLNKWLVRNLSILIEFNIFVQKQQQKLKKTHFQKWLQFYRGQKKHSDMIEAIRQKIIKKRLREQ